MSQPQKLKSSVKSGSGVSRARSVSPFDRKAFAGKLVAGLKDPIQKILSQPASRGRVTKMLRTIQLRLEKELGAFPPMVAGNRAPGSNVKRAPVRHARKTLPVEDLAPADVLAKGMVSMSSASLYRAVAEKKFYSVAPKGLTNGRLFPAWQFVDPVPDLLPPVLAALGGSPPREIHAFLVSVADQLNELAPAEVLAGQPMATRGKLHPSQDRLLALPARERQKLVTAQIGVEHE